MQRSLCLEEVTDDSSSTRVELSNGADNQTRDKLELCMATCGKAAAARAKIRSRARKEASTQEVRGSYKLSARAKHLEWKSWIDNEVFDLVDLRRFKPKNYVTGRWVLAIETNKQGNFLRAKGEMGIERIPGQTKGLPPDRFSCDLKTAFLQGQSYDVNCDVVCQLPQEAGHPPYTAAILKKPAYC